MPYKAPNLNLSQLSSRQLRDRRRSRPEFVSQPPGQVTQSAALLTSEGTNLER